MDEHAPNLTIGNDAAQLSKRLASSGYNVAEGVLALKGKHQSFSLPQQTLALRLACAPEAGAVDVLRAQLRTIEAISDAALLLGPISRLLLTLNEGEYLEVHLIHVCVLVSGDSVKAIVSRLGG